MPETCKNYILNCSSSCGSGSVSLSVSVSMSAAVAMPLAAHKFNKQGARAGQDTLSLPIAPLLPGLLYVFATKHIVSRAETMLLLDVDKCGQQQPKTKTKSIAGKTQLPALKCRQYKFGKLFEHTHTH